MKIGGEYSNQNVIGVKLYPIGPAPFRLEVAELRLTGFTRLA